MPVPTLEAEGTVAAVTTGNLTVTLPAHQTDDIFVIPVQIFASNAQTNVAAPTGWVRIGENTFGNSTSGGSFQVFITRATSNSEANPTFTRPFGSGTGTGTVFAGRAYVIRGAKSSSFTLYTGFNSGTLTANANANFGLAQIQGTENLAVQFYHSTDDNSAGAARSGWTNGTEETTTTGAGACFQTQRRTITAQTAAAASSSTAVAQGSGRWINVSFTGNVVRFSLNNLGTADRQPVQNDTTLSNTSAIFSTTVSRYATKFVANAGKVNLGRSALSKSGSPTGDLYMKIYSDSSGSPDAVLATSNAVAASGVTSGSTTLFTFPSAEKITLVAGTTYWVSVEHTASTATNRILIASLTRPMVAPPHQYTTSWALSSYSNPITAFIEYATNTSVVSKPPIQRTASGTGTGSSSVTSKFYAVFQRTATSSGTGSSSVSFLRNAIRSASASGDGSSTITSFKLLYRTATASGLGDSGNTTRRKLLRSGTANGGATTGDLATGVVTRLRTALASGQSDSSVLFLIHHKRTSTANGVGSSVSVSFATRTRTASGSGIGTSSSTKRRILFRSSLGLGEGLGSSTEYKYLIFYTPTTTEIRPADRYDTSIAGRLFRYAEPTYAGVNVYKLSDGTYTTTETRDAVLKTYWGGTKNFVTPEEKADLVAAGYDGYIT